MKQDLNLYFHQLKFTNTCLEEKATGFQTFFEKIMVKADPSFVPIKPSGRDGDWKCDGFSSNSGTVYQCYAPETPNVNNTINKIRKDFSGAKNKWNGKMKRWAFVYGASDNRLPARVYNEIEEIRKDNKSIIVETWGRDKLWEIVSKLSIDHRNDLLGYVPDSFVATEVTSAELETLMNYLVEISAPINNDDMALTDLANKLEKNKLQDNIEPIIKNSIGISNVVEGYIKKHPDALYSSKVANALISKYKELSKELPDDPEQVYWQLINYVNKGANSPKIFWAASGIVTYYFQLCDIFEK